jgi:hypothetical protein
MAAETVAYSRAEGLTADERWAAWVARGAEHDKKVKSRAIAIAVAVAAGGAVWLAIVLLG